MWQVLHNSVCYNIWCEVYVPNRVESSVFLSFSNLKHLPPLVLMKFSLNVVENRIDGNLKMFTWKQMHDSMKLTSNKKKEGRRLYFHKRDKPTKPSSYLSWSNYFGCIFNHFFFFLPLNYSFAKSVGQSFQQNMDNDIFPTMNKIDINLKFIFTCTSPPRMKGFIGPKNILWNLCIIISLNR